MTDAHCWRSDPSFPRRPRPHERSPHDALYQDTALKFLGIYADGPIVLVEEEMTATLPKRTTLQVGLLLDIRMHRVARMREHMDTMSGHRQVFGDGHPLAAALPLSRAT